MVGEIDREISRRKELQSGWMILLDESGEEREGKKTVGAARQYIGRAGKVDMERWACLRPWSLNRRFCDSPRLDGMGRCR
jgi:hypothetical protein